MALFILMFLLSAAAAEEIVKFVGDDVTLRCEAGDGFIRAVEWTRPDLKKGEYVLFYSDGRSDSKHQQESFRNRVQLVDRQPQDRDVSLILKNVTNNDAGTHECRVSLDASRRKKRGVLDEEPISVINLMVKDRDSSDGNFSRIHRGLVLAVVGGVVVLLLLVSCIAGFLFWKPKRANEEDPTQKGYKAINKSPSSLQPAADSPPV